MPVIAVNLSQKTYADIMALVAKDAYSGPEQFLEIAAFNQLALERGLSPEDLLKGIFRPVDTAERSQHDVRNDQSTPRRARRVAMHPPRPGREKVAAVGERSAPVELSQDEVRAALSRFKHPHDTSSLSPCEAVPTAGSRRIWGQVNRLFPLKAACRWIINAAAVNGRWPDLHFVMDRLALDTSVLGSSLERCDDEAGRKRGEMLGTGLPRKGNLQSSDRYLTQFIARVTRSTEIYPGAISDYALGCVSREAVVLTGPGVKLALIKNPILDGENATATLSPEEQAFLLQHISEHVSSEKSDFHVVLQAIKDRNSTPTRLMTATRPHFPPEWTDVVFRTHVYGVLARLSELGVIAKQREGRRVEYQVAKPGLNILAA